MAEFVFIFASFIVVLALIRPLSFAWYFIRAYILTRIGFYKDLRKYGEWAVVTGASDGIGKEYAKQLALYGLNIFLISRSEDKLENIAEEIRKESKVQVRVLVFDFGDVLDYGKVSSALEGLDIGVLVNNVGTLSGTLGFFHKADVERIVNVMNVNMISDVRMTHMVLPGMIERKRGAIVHLSSISAYMKIPTVDVYPGSKIFMKKLAETLMLESKGLVHHQVVTPAYVESNMSRKKPGFTIPSAKDFVASAIKTIGVVDVTCGYPSHEFVSIVVSLIPLWFIFMFYRMVSPTVGKKKD